MESEGDIKLIVGKIERQCRKVLCQQITKNKHELNIVCSLHFLLKIPTSILISRIKDWGGSGEYK